MVVSFQATEACRGIEIHLHPFLTSVLFGGELLTSRHHPFTPGKETQCPFNRKLGWPLSRTRRFGEEQTSCRNRDSNTGSEIWVEES
jgi:hypothetical protein